MEPTLTALWGFFENLILVALACYFFYKQLESFKDRRCRKNVGEQLQKQQENYDERYVRQIERSTTFLRQQKHDFLGHIKIMSVLINARKITELKDYFTELIGEYRQEPLIVLTSNTSFNALVTSKVIEAKSLGIPFEVDIHLLHSMPISNIELTTLMVNIIDNAIEACLKVKNQEKRFIKLIIKDAADMDMIMITAKNSSSGAYRMKGGRLLTTSMGYIRGLGMAKIRSLVEEAGGFVEIQPQDSEFTITIMMPAGSRVAEGPNASYFSC
jgi:sensor histidine kinase regulating citrate/malate metabolism